MRNDNAMIWWLSGLRQKEGWTTAMVRARLGLSSVDDVLRTNRLRWYGHIKRMEEEAWQQKVTSFEIDDAPMPRGRPKKRWMDNVRKDLKDLHLKPEDTQDRNAWRSRISCRGPEGVQPPDMGNIRT